MAEVTPDLLLSDEEFDALNEDEQSAYLSLIGGAGSKWTLTEKQLLADRLADQVDEILYGGSAGGGKSEWILHRSLRLSLEIPGHRSLVLRTSFPELRRSLIQRSIILFAQHTTPAERPHWRASDKEWRFPNGSVIEYGYLASDDEVAQFLSAEYDMIAFDELTQFSQYQFDMVRSRARTTKSMLAKGSRPHVIAATNPGQKGHAWAKETFVTATNYGERGVTTLVAKTDGDEMKWVVAEPSGDDVVRTVAFVPSTVLDNPHIDPGYVRQLRTLPVKLQKQYLYGDWDVFFGQFFDDFKKSEIDAEGNLRPWHVQDPFPIPDSWPKLEAIDWGFSNPFGCLWLAWDPDGICYVYRERYLTRHTPEMQAKAVLSGRGRERIDRTTADPACWQHREQLTIVQQWQQAGLRCSKANNDRISGWQRVREYLKPDEFEDAEGNQVKRPGLVIFTTCPNLIRTLPEQIHDKNKPEDLDTTLEDHLADCLRYGLMTRPRRVISRAPILTGMQARVANSFKRRKHPSAPPELRGKV